jgi:hypothetical protein
MPRKAPDPLRVASRLLDILGPGVVVIGGHAVSAWGFVRATEDVDLAVDLTMLEVERRLARSGIEFRRTRGDVREGDVPWVIHGELGGVPFQGMPPMVALDWSRARELELGGARLRIVDLGDLLRLKLKAAGPKDLMDVAELLKAYPERTAETRATAEAYGVGEDLERWLARPRPRPGAKRKS